MKKIRGWWLNKDLSLQISDKEVEPWVANYRTVRSMSLEETIKYFGEEEYLWPWDKRILILQEIDE